MNPNSSNGIQIRPILDNDFILIQFPVDIFDRASCALIDDVLTNDEGIFDLKSYDGQDLIMKATVDQRDVIAVIERSQLRSNSANDIFLSENPITQFTVEGTGIGTEKMFSTDDDIMGTYQATIANYPLDKVRISFFDANDIFLSSMDANEAGQFSGDLPLKDPGVYNLIW